MTSLALAGLTAGIVQSQADARPGTQAKSSNSSDARWDPVSVQLPASAVQFPAGEGAAIANSQCLICHSAGMVLTQPARTEQQWKETINKMRTAYGAPLPAEQVDPLATYLSRLEPDAEASRATD
jgi:mono/diheme cytochrome c family protein